ncbi:hypothetical protein BDEG_26264 [Batrachochytrium dendrobatidis JEL423]|uniref:LIM zinc-binding domain-containing protein n=1 Tax=Batrachochytrium dendrobatidis (strain JEL423) TaxID=403673 RepID=A0A177WT92_BATDL|nr:hypothetical protein BDEG_26264 [Batrachochytrium dendrobatidis JEL423]
MAYRAFQLFESDKSFIYTSENCGRPLVGSTFIRKDDKPYCKVCPIDSTKKKSQALQKNTKGKLFCMADYEKNMAQICYACRKPIVGRSTSAIGKIYHPEHFSCWKCEKPFDGAPYFELNSQPYCEAHYKELTGSVCQYCKSAAKGNGMLPWKVN